MGLMITQLHNQTPWQVDFDVDDRICPRLSPGQIRKVKLSRVCKRCRELGSPEWPFGVLINNEPSGMYIHPYDHLLKCTRIVFKYEPDAGGLLVLCVHASQEIKKVDRFLRLIGIGYILGRNKSWNKRLFIEIARADPAINTLRENIHEDDPPLNTVAPLVLRDDNSTPLIRNIKPKKIKPKIMTSPTLWRDGNGSPAATSPLPQQERVPRQRSNGGITIAPTTINPPNPISGGSPADNLKRDQRRLNYRVLATQRRLIHLLLFMLSFTSVCFVRFYC